MTWFGEGILKRLLAALRSGLLARFRSRKRRGHGTPPVQSVSTGADTNAGADAGGSEPEPEPAAVDGRVLSAQPSDLRQMAITRRQIRETKARVQYLTDLRELRMREVGKHPK